MPQATREIKRRIKSIKSTRQITKAMEMVSVVKMKKAVNAVLRTRRYSCLAWEIISSLSNKVDASLHPLLQTKDAKKIALVAFTSNRGLCGGFNSQLINAVNSYVKIKKEQEGIEVDLVVMGRRGRDAFFKLGHNVIAEFEKLDVAERITEVLPIAKIVTEDYISNKYGKVAIAYTDYESSLSQKPRVRVVLPISGPDGTLGSVGRDDGIKGEEVGCRRALKEEFSEYIFEPSPAEVLTQVIPRLVETQLFQALLETNASEHAARMIAMRNATEAAEDMIDDLTFSFNQARQSSVTQEIAEISGSKIALENG